ncbi:putative restriction endonuclease domain protein [Escherichia coli MP021017.6]|nr:putative restriction endonuclease domain protein [Escherichia coli MP021017.6]EMU86324.1 putative restriction endonuclease domain protein [Escherichia coli MP021017.4]EMU87750.1 putative restriction endonuclease domain protein [Escherichia coli MP021017.3]EMV05638.1 putative restriction endonuclease domain protein [Escherichia coli MP021017.11]EMV11421.1 putative restriction endonuclease domain protein [Escherichia coli MP021017.12]EMV81622.1 putative restriction endonuclease domain protein
MIAIISLPGISMTSSKSLQQAIANIKIWHKGEQPHRINHCYCYTY